MFEFGFVAKCLDVQLLQSQVHTCAHLKKTSFILQFNFIQLNSKNFIHPPAAEHIQTHITHQNTQDRMTR